MTLARMDARVLPGNGVISRTSSCALVVAPTGEHDTVEALIGILRAASTEGVAGRVLVHQLAQYITTSNLDDLPDFAVVADDPRGIAYLVKGGVVIGTVGPGGENEHSGLASLTFLDGYLAEATEITVRPVDASMQVGPPPGTLIEGTVPGSGVILTVSGEVDPSSPPQEEVPSEDGLEETLESSNSMSSPASGKSFETIDLSDMDLGDLKPLPVATAHPEPTTEEPDPEEGAELVPGVRCKRGHFNHPKARFCAQCGIGMEHLTRNIVHDIRPPLGILVFTDGSTYLVDTDYVIGRDPSIHPEVESGEARGIRLDDDGRISRAHLTLKREGWEVYITDRSANGTEIMGAGDWARMVQDEPRHLQPGSKIRFGDYQFTYDSHHHVGG